MWFKNLQVYRLGALSITRNAFAEALQAHAFSPLGSNEALRAGFVPPVPDSDGLLYEVGGHWLLRMDTESKILPAAYINRVAKARADELEEQQGFPPGKRAMKELKERVADELMPRAFTRLVATHVWIDPAAGWLVVDAASATGADAVVKLLLKAIDKLPIESLRVASSPVGSMTQWLADDDTIPHKFTIDQDAELRATGESRAAVRYVKHSLDHVELNHHIAGGKQCTRLAMTWNSRVSFTLTEALEVKGVRPLDVIKESETVTYSDQERFDNDVVLMTGELRALLTDLVDALGGHAA